MPVGLYGFGDGPVRAGRRRVRPGQTTGPAREQDSGSVVAEFAVALPAVVLVLGLCLGAVQVASQQVRLTDAAADAARTLARGDAAAVAEARVRRLSGGAQMSTSTRGEFICVELAAPAGLGPASLVGLRVRASGCALAGGL